MMIWTRLISCLLLLSCVACSENTPIINDNPPQIYPDSLEGLVIIQGLLKADSTGRAMVDTILIEDNFYYWQDSTNIKFWLPPIAEWLGKSVEVKGLVYVNRNHTIKDRNRYMKDVRYLHLLE